MLKKVKYLFVMFTLLMVGAAELSAQETASKVSGLILDKSNSTRLGDVNVVNLRTKGRVTTNSFGVFFIEASVGDSLSITKVGFGPQKTVLYTLEDILLELQPGLTIEEVVIARKTRQQEMEDIMRDYEKKGIYNGGRNSVGTYLNSPATALYNLFGREAKNMKRFEKYMNQEVEEISVDRIFSMRVVGETTKLTGNELRNFMDLYRPSYAVAKSWGQYDLLNYINSSFKKWDSEGRPAPISLPKLEIPSQN